MSGTGVLTSAPVEGSASVEDHRTRVALDKRARMRARLVAAIMELWPQTHGGVSVVIDDVVKAADVSRGTFYKYFASLEEALDSIGRQLADEMTIGIMPVYDTLTDPLHRTSTGFQLFQWRAAFDPVWARFVSRTDHLFCDPELLANLVVDLENGRSAGLYRFGSIELATNFVLGATLAGVREAEASEAGAAHIVELTRMVLLGLGVDAERARETILSTRAHVSACAPGRLAWWQGQAHVVRQERSAGT